MEPDGTVWQGRTNSPVLIGFCLVLVIGAIAMAPLFPIVSALLVVSLLFCLPFVSVRATVDAGGLGVRCGPLGWPRKQIEIRSIAAVQCREVRPREWGGWGYRITKGRSAMVLRRAPGIVVDLADGRLFAVAVSDAAAGTALLDAYLRQRDPA